MTEDPMTEGPRTEDRSAYLRAQQHYGELLADFHRTQAEIAAEQDAKLAPHCPAAPTPPTPAFDDDDFSHNTYLR